MTALHLQEVPPTRTAGGIPALVAQLARLLARLPGAVAVVLLDGRREIERPDRGTDSDVGVYYRRRIDLRGLAALGAVHPPGSWGRVMNGGLLIQRGGGSIRVLLRDLDVVEYWTDRAGSGEYEVDGVPGYLAGIPTYTLAAELASCRVLYGEVPAVASFPRELSANAPRRWRSRRAASIDHARAYARRGDTVGAAGQAAKAMMEEAHAIVCSQGLWVLGENELIRAAGLEVMQSLAARVPSQSALLTSWLQVVDQTLRSASAQP